MPLTSEKQANRLHPSLERFLGIPQIKTRERQHLIARHEVPLLFPHGIDQGRMYALESLNLDKVKMGILPHAPHVYDYSGNLMRTELMTDTHSGQRELQVFDGSGNSEMLAVLEQHGDIWKIRPGGFNFSLSDKIRGGYPVPVAGWSKLDFMHMDFSRAVESAFIDIPSPVLQMLMKQKRALLHRLKKEAAAVYVGSNYSAAGVIGKDMFDLAVPFLNHAQEHDITDEDLKTLWELGNAEGLWSVMHKHDHDHIFDGQLDKLLQSETIMQARLHPETTWDNGLSTIVGGWIKQDMDPILGNFANLIRGRVAHSHADNMGYAAQIEFCGINEFTDPAFIDMVLRPLCLIVHRKLVDIHGDFYDSHLDSVIDFVRAQHHSDHYAQHQFDLPRYLRFFRRKKPDAYTARSEHLTLLDNLHNMHALRPGYGWAGGWRVGENSAGNPTLDLYVTLAFLNSGGMGPIEGMCLDFYRSKKPLSADETAVIFDLIRKIQIEALAG